MAPWIIPLILSAASIGSNYAGQRKVDKNRANALREESSRRKRLDEEATAKAKSTADILLSTADTEKTKAAELESAYTRAAEQPIEDPGAMQFLNSPRTSTAFVESDQRAEANTAARLKQRAQALATLGSFGDVMGANQIKVGRNAADIGNAGSAMQNWSHFVLPAQLEAANQAGDTWKALADVLQVAATVYGMNALSKPAAAAGTAATTSSVPTAASGASAGGIEASQAAARSTQKVFATPFGKTTVFDTTPLWNEPGKTTWLGGPR